MLSTICFFTFLPLTILSPYIRLSAILTASQISSLSICFVQYPIARDIIIPWAFLFFDSLIILSLIISHSYSSVFGSNIAYSSPPVLTMISSPLQLFLSISAVSIRSLSPISWPKTSFVSFNPFTSKTIVLNGRFRFVSSLFIASSIYLLLYKPVIGSLKLKNSISFCLSFLSL